MNRFHGNEVIYTEQNKKNGELGETRTFSIQQHSADTIKKNINSANEQSLERKNQAAVQNRPRNASPNSAHASMAGQNVRPVSEQPRPRVQNPSGTAQPMQNTVRPAAQNGSGNPQNHGQMQNPVRPSVQQVNQPAARMTGNPAQARPQQNRPIANTNMNSQANLQANSEVRRTVPQTKAQQKPEPVGNEARAVVPRGETLPEKRQEQRVSRLESSLVQKSAEVTQAQKTRPENMNAQMMKTKKTDIAAIQGQKAKPKKDEKEKIYSDEGGNTVVSIVKAVVYIIFVLVISVFLALCIINIGNDVFSFVKSDEIVEIEIPEFATLDEVADILFMNDIIKYPTVFKMFAVAKKSDTDFLAGTYSVNAMMSYEVLLSEFKEKPEVGTVDITIPEGYTVDEIIDLFVEGYGMGTREGFIDVIQNGEFDYWFIDELEKNGTHEGRIYRLEGYLFPDTYQFYKASSEWTIVNKMLKRFTQIFTKEYRAQCEVFGYTVDEMITLASMIEKEAGSPAEFFMVSSVFHNRLNAPWQFPKLESDATVVYVVSHENGERTAITAADLDMDTPYNTYLYNGLPPSPIANPSASAMLAALSPQTSNYYFFIANKGVTYYSETKTQHEAYIAEFAAGEVVQQTTADIPVQ